jgi:branched-chain amino acid transport system permease protein
MAIDKQDIPLGTPMQRVTPLIVTFIIIALVGPWLLSAYWLNTFTSVACLTLVGATVALLYGQLGMVSLTQFALAGVGGWVCLRVIHGFGVSFEFGLIVGACAAGLFGLLVGLPALRMRGLYLALLTLLVAAAFQVVVNVIGFPDGGEGWTGKVINGQRALIERPALATTDGAYFRYAVVWMAAGLVWIEWQKVSRLGRAWALIRKGEAAAISAGVSVVRYKATAFAMSGALAGLAGGLIAGLNGQLDNTGFHSSQSILLYALVVVGGAYHWVGAVIAALLIRALPALLNDHGVDGNLANVFFGFALLVSLIQGRTGIAGQLADFYKFVRMSRIIEGSIAWACISIALGIAAHWLGWTSFSGALFIALIALLFRMAIPGVLWMLLGFLGKPMQSRAEDLEASISKLLVHGMKKSGLRPDHRLFKRLLNWTFIGFFVAWVAWGVFDLAYLQALAMVWVTLVVKVMVEVSVYGYVLPWRKRVDLRYPKPFANYL